MTPIFTGRCLIDTTYICKLNAEYDYLVLSRTLFFLLYLTVVYRYCKIHHLYRFRYIQVSVRNARCSVSVRAFEHLSSIICSREERLRTSIHSKSNNASLPVVSSRRKASTRPLSTTESLRYGDCCRRAEGQRKTRQD